MAVLKSILNTLGLEDERVWPRWISAAEGKKFADTVTEFTKELKEQGPNPVKKYWST